MPLNDESAPLDPARRRLLASAGAGLLAVTVGSVWGPISPAEARSRGVTLKHLTAAEAQTLEALGEVILPGAAAAGIAHFVDDQLSSTEPLLMLRYVDFPMPFMGFYRQGLGSLNQLSQTRHQVSFHQASPVQKIEMVRSLAQQNPPEWEGPPAPLFYFVSRSDAVDVVYGTEEGFARLNIPYMAHIAPPSSW